jgi:flagellar hook-associated protein 2
MDLGLSGLASGLDWKTLVNQLADVERAPQRRLRTEQSTLANRNNAYGSIKTQLAVLQNRVNTLKDPSFFDSRTASSADSTIATASVTAGAALGTYSFNVTQLATAARKLGGTNAGAAISATNDVSGVTIGSAGFSTAVTAGKFTVNGKQIEVAATDTLQQVFDRINSQTGGEVTASYDASSDRIQLTASSGEVVLGSATDTSNFLAVTRLSNNGTGTTTSSAPIGGVKLTGSMASSNLGTAISDGGSGAGKFKINGVEISFDATNDSIQNVLDRINSSAAGVTASYDSVNDRFALTNKTTGDVGVALEDVTGNFLASTGLNGGTSTLERGKDLLYTVNGGATLRSRSNVITSDSSGITGLTVNALKEGSTTTVNVSTDTSRIKSAIQSFIDDYNRAQSTIDTQTASSTDSSGKVTSGLLASEGYADDIASRLRSISFNQTTGLTGTLSSLAKIGIDSSGDSNALSISDSDALDSAINNNLSDLKALFTDSTNGIGTKLASYLDSTIGDGGTLIAKQDALTKQSSDIDTQVTDLEKLVQSNRQRMIDSFVQMETAQQTINQQLKYLQQRFGS